MEENNNMKVLFSIILLGFIFIGYKYKNSFFRKKYTLIPLCFIAVICLFVNWSPKLTLIVPKGYIGRVCLIKSSVKEDILTIDSNGIGYLTTETFDKVTSKPTVIEVDGTNINNRAVGFNPSAFWASGEFSEASIEGNARSKTILFLSFEIVPKGKEGQTQYYSTDLAKVVDTTKILW